MDGRLYRSQEDRVLAGVAGGLAELWDADPALVRILWVLAAIFTGGLALVVYIIMAIVVPEESVVYPNGRPEVAGATAGAAAGTGAGVDGAPVAPDGAPAWVSRAEARRARRAARRAARHGRDEHVGLAIGGAVLILVGSWFLLREWIPGLDFDWIWPGMLIAVGVLIIVLSLDRRPARPGGAG